MTRRVLQELFITGADQAAELDGPGGKGDEPTSTIWVRAEARHLIRTSDLPDSRTTSQ